MNSPKRNRARVLTASGLEKLRAQRRSHEVEENAGYKYSLERLGELTGLDPETVRNVVDCKGSDKRTLSRFFETFGLTLEDSDHIQAVQAWAAPPDPNFVGRDEAIADLNALVSRNARVIVIQARGGVGKTTLARKYLQQEFGSFLEFPIAKETKDIASIEGLLEEKLRQLGEEPGREFLVSIDRLKRKLQTERIGILIDNLEPALDAAGKFIEAHRRYVELLRVLADPTVKSITLITSRERLREPSVTVQHYRLSGLNLEAWEQFFGDRQLASEGEAIASLNNAYGGNAKAMDILSGTILEDFGGDVVAYWQANQEELFIERDLEDLVTTQFNRLQQLDPDAYKLLCRMGCYRYQDVPTVPIAGLLFLLWDISKNRHRSVIKSLQDRSLIDCEDGEFWLHPVMREEAIQRLMAGNDWEITNYRAADFWPKNTENIRTIKDALKASEAYYHYESLTDFELIENAIQEEIRCKWQKDILWFEFSSTIYRHLGSSFYMLGEPEYTKSLINRVLNCVKFKHSRSKLHHVLGDFYRLSGQLKNAIKLYEVSREEAIECLDALSRDYSPTSLIIIQLRRLEVASWFDIGLCKLNAWEFEEATQSFEVAKSKIEKYNDDGSLGCENLYVFAVNPVLAYTSLLLGFPENASRFFKETHSEFLSDRLDFKNQTSAFLLLGKTCKNLEDIDIPFEIFQTLIVFAEQREEPLIKSRVFRGLAELNRKQRNFDQALFCHSEEIRLILENRGAKCDLAEAYYQLGLTHQLVDDIEKSRVNFQEAIRLFIKMEAPKQVKRVKKSMQSST